MVLHDVRGRSTRRWDRSTSGSARLSARTPTTGTEPGSWASSSRRFRPPGWCTPGAPRSADDEHEMLLQAHRYKYGWKHGVDPHRAPPYYNREIADYVGTFRVPGPGRSTRSATGLRHRPQQDGHLARSTRRSRSSASRASTGAVPAIRQLVEASRDRGDPLLARLDQRFDAFSDIQVLSDQLRAPGRAVSRKSLHPHRPSRRGVGREPPPTRRWPTKSDTPPVTTKARFLEVDEVAWRDEWQEHVEAVRSYFSGRDDFLEIDLGAEPRWQPLCDVLGLPEPSKPFPWVNRSGAVERAVGS